MCAFAGLGYVSILGRCARSVANVGAGKWLVAEGDPLTQTRATRRVLRRILSPLALAIFLGCWLTLAPAYPGFLVRSRSRTRP